MKKRLVIFGLVMLLMVALIGCGSSETGENSSDKKLTLEKYEQIENGMTYEDVIAIIGFEVSPEVESGEKGTDLYTVSYRYMGSDQVKGNSGANASFMFQGGKLNMKAQAGLK